MECPICGATAQEDSKTGHLRTIRCPSCGDYDVSDTVYDTGMLQRLTTEQRLRALEKAKTAAAPGKRPMITTYMLG